MSASGGFPGGGSRMSSISASGRYVAFASGAADLVAGDTNGAVDVFVRDRRNGTTIRLPLPGGKTVPPGGQAYEPSISADGSVVAFTYLSPSGVAAGQQVVLGLEPARRAQTEIVLPIDPRHRHRGATSRRSPPTGATSPTRRSNGLIVANDGDQADDVFRYDRTTQRTDPRERRGGR